VIDSFQRLYDENGRKLLQSDYEKLKQDDNFANNFTGI
jgi:hypothetical protein